LVSRKVSKFSPTNLWRNIVRAEVDRQPVLEGREIMLIRKMQTDYLSEYGRRGARWRRENCPLPGRVDGRLPRAAK